MSRWLPSILSALVFLTGQRSLEGDVPKRICLDLRPAIIRTISRRIGKYENCQHNNPGCLLGKHGYARFQTAEQGWAELEDWWWKHQNYSLRRSFSLYNNVREDYTEIILRGTGLSEDLVIAEHGCEYVTSRYQPTEVNR